MDQVAGGARLSEMSTEWAIVLEASSDSAECAQLALETLLKRYIGAVRLYLKGAVRDVDAAADLEQEFAVRFLGGDFRRADPDKGRFRDYLKRALRNLVNDHYRRRRRDPISSDAIQESAAPSDGDADFEGKFLESWRNHLLDRSWESLHEEELATGKPFHTVLRARVDHPRLHSAELAELVAGSIGRRLSAHAYRQALLRARKRYVGFLTREVAASLDKPTFDQIEEELVELKLLEFCRPHFKRPVAP